MDKQTYLKAFYISQITALIEHAENTETLDLIYRLLKSEVKTT